MRIVVILALGVLGLAGAVAAAPEGSDAAAAPGNGFWSSIAQKPWAMRLARMWAEKEAEDPAAEAMGPRGEAIMNLIERGNIFPLFKQGGPIMFPLLAASMLALAAVIERMSFFTLERGRRNVKDLRRFLDAVRHREFDKAKQIGQRTKFFVIRVIAYGLAHREHSLENALELAQGRELRRYRRGITILDTVITLSPLLGLLGTVTGMMSSFSLIGGDLSSPGAITGGIAEALLGTAFGLGIAIVSLIPYNLINQRLEQATKEIEEASVQLQVMLTAAPAKAGT